MMRDQRKPAMEVKPLHPIFAAELIGADLTKEPTPELIETVENAMAHYGVVVVRDAEITDEEQIRFSRAFGPLEIPSRPRGMAAGPNFKPRMAPELFGAGNIDMNGNIRPYDRDGQNLGKGAERFHTDSSFHSMPTKWSLLLGHETPPPEAGGDTWFVDARAAYDDLSPETKERIENLVGLHEFWKGRQNAGFKGEITPEMRKSIPYGVIEHPLVRTMPSGRKTLFVGGHCIGVKGMSEDEGLALIEDLYSQATQEKYIYRHKWRRWDITIWDNRCTMHAATPLHSDDYRRDMRRTTINEYGPETSAMEALGIA
jgi:alpha-ketoglutarate-dependent 2,4-dichlorophenoxyacetate dioxygenase